MYCHSSSYLNMSSPKFSIYEKNIVQKSSWDFAS